jgi:alanine transaminase
LSLIFQGSYTESEGIRIVRQDVARFIEERDEGIPCDWNNVHLTTGASDAIKAIMEILLTNPTRGEKRAGFMIPIPQYPFYTATIAEYLAQPIGYYLDEDRNWGLDIKELERFDYLNSLYD